MIASYKFYDDKIHTYVKDDKEVSLILIERSQKLLKEKIVNIPKEKHSIYKERLNMELKILVEKNFCDYFLVTADLVKFAKDNSIQVGKGRGQAGSLVAYALGITDIDPIEFGLIFERFLNPQRKSLPDFDIDVCPERRNY